jgi:putative ABC transport system permease protein
MGTMLLIYTPAVAARSRAHELAITRALGMPSRRLRRVLAWQGAVLATAIVIIGVPIGLVLGFPAWNAVAKDLGVVHTATVTSVIGLAIPLALLVGVAASLPPARRALRHPAAPLLHVE